MARSRERSATRPLGGNGDGWFMGVTGLLSLAPVAVVLGMLGFLAITGVPVLRLMGFRFFTGAVWNLGNLYAPHPVWVHGVRVMPGAEFGTRVFLVGTALTSLLALGLAAPTGLLAAAAVAFSLPASVRRPIAALVETLAGVPSVVYGLFGLMTVGPFVFQTLGPFLNRILTPLPFVSGPVNTPTNLLTAVIILTLMVMPIVTATGRAAIEQVPQEWLDGARALGWTEWEVFHEVVWPTTRTALVGAVMLGLGRALGETMAVLMVSGNALNVLPANWYSAVSTMAATIAAQLDSAFTDPTGMAVKALGLLGLTLMLLTLAANLVARGLVRRGTRRIGMEGS
jgi:phosphate transport system permease protein